MSIIMLRLIYGWTNCPHKARRKKIHDDEDGSLTFIPVLLLPHSSDEPYDKTIQLLKLLELIMCLRSTLLF